MVTEIILDETTTSVCIGDILTPIVLDAGRILIPVGLDGDTGVLGGSSVWDDTRIWNDLDMWEEA